MQSSCFDFCSTTQNVAVVVVAVVGGGDAGGGSVVGGGGRVAVANDDDDLSNEPRWVDIFYRFGFWGQQSAPLLLFVRLFVCLYELFPFVVSLHVVSIVTTVSSRSGRIWMCACFVQSSF